MIMPVGFAIRWTRAWGECRLPKSWVHPAGGAGLLFRSGGVRHCTQLRSSWNGLWLFGASI